jgi:hypothetical protein
VHGRRRRSAGSPLMGIKLPKNSRVAIAITRRVKAATLIHAVRVAVTGESGSPGLFDVLALVGQERSGRADPDPAVRVTFAPCG